MHEIIAISSNNIIINHITVIKLMKKYLCMTALLLAAIFTLASCGKDDEPKVKTTATNTYFLALSQDLLDACNVFIRYKAENGLIVQKAIIDPTWNGIVTSNKFPAEFGVQFTFSPKQDSELTKDKYNLECRLNFNCKTSRGAIYANEINVMEDQKSPVAKKNVNKTLKSYNGKIYGFRITEDGNPTVDNKMNFDMN